MLRFREPLTRRDGCVLVATTALGVLLSVGLSKAAAVTDPNGMMATPGSGRLQLPLRKIFEEYGADFSTTTSYDDDAANIELPAHDAYPAISINLHCVGKTLVANTFLTDTKVLPIRTATTDKKDCANGKIDFFDDLPFNNPSLLIYAPRP